ncbi:2OG-Fe(II) oxygenase [Sphingosinicella sp.]|uniref:2OG-Fe(II) oxygenase n=1 Tax=Sphingosinicella sp. TaxID=1917971 RepID=UPI004037605E
MQAFQLLGAGRAPEAILIVNRLAAQGDANAQLTLAEMTWGGMVKQDPVAARVLFEKSAQGGNAIAATRVTNLLASGIAGARDWGAALDRLGEEARRDPARKAALELIVKMRLDDAGDPVTLPAPERLSDAPDVIMSRQLFTAAECDYLARLAAPGFTPSVVNDAAGKAVRDPIRTSDGSTLHWLIEDPAVHALNRRLAAAAGTDAGQGEAMQILRYRPGEQYRPHFDFVRASDNQRMMTALVYLNEDYEGGETSFVKTGLKVKGLKGDALIFRSATADREIDPLSEHAGLPVTRGVKLLASRWIREKRWVP